MNWYKKAIKKLSESKNCHAIDSMPLIEFLDQKYSQWGNQVAGIFYSINKVFSQEENERRERNDPSESKGNQYADVSWWFTPNRQEEYFVMNLNGLEQYLIEKFEKEYGRSPKFVKKFNDRQSYLENYENFVPEDVQNPQGTFYISVYEKSRAFGGQEEGGWWYDDYQYIKTITTLPSYDEAIKFAEQLCEKIDTSEYNIGSEKRALEELGELPDPDDPKYKPKTQKDPEKIERALEEAGINVWKFENMPQTIPENAQPSEEFREFFGGEVRPGSDTEGIPVGWRPSSGELCVVVELKPREEETGNAPH